MKIIIETPRLVLREFVDEDSEFIIRLLNSPGWLRFIGDRKVHSSEDAINYLKKGPMTSYSINGFGLWHVSLKEEGTPIGMCGLLKRDTLEDPDIGFALLPEFGKMGFAQEMAQATLSFGMQQLNMSRIVAITDPENINSIALLKKLGLNQEKTIVMPGDTLTLLFFGIQANDAV